MGKSEFSGTLTHDFKFGLFAAIISLKLYYYLKIKIKLDIESKMH